LNAYLRINELIQNQGSYVCEQTIDNYGHDSCVLVTSSLVDLYGNVDYWRTPNANRESERVCGLFMPNYGN
jgi:hypothetical protein